jgi:hypothetical protein
MYPEQSISKIVLAHTRTLLSRNVMRQYSLGLESDTKVWRTPGQRYLAQGVQYADGEPNMTWGCDPPEVLAQSVLLIYLAHTNQQGLTTCPLHFALLLRVKYVYFWIANRL